MRVNDSQTYRKIDVIRERIRRIFELREIPLSFQTGFNLSIQLSQGACDCLKLMSVSFDVLVDAADVNCHQLGLTDLHAVGCEGFVETLNLFASSSSSDAKLSMSSAKRRLVIVLPPILTMPSLSSKASVLLLSRNKLKRVGESRHPCRTPLLFGTSPLCCR